MQVALSPMSIVLRRFLFLRHSRLKECDKPIISVIENDIPFIEFSILNHQNEESGKAAHDFHRSSTATKALLTSLFRLGISDHCE